MPTPFISAILSVKTQVAMEHSIVTAIAFFVYYSGLTVKKINKFSKMVASLLF